MRAVATALVAVMALGTASGTRDKSQPAVDALRGELDKRSASYVIGPNCPGQALVDLQDGGFDRWSVLSTLEGAVAAHPGNVGDVWIECSRRRAIGKPAEATKYAMLYPSTLKTEQAKSICLAAVGDAGVVTADPRLGLLFVDATPGALAICESTLAQLDRLPDAGRALPTCVGKRVEQDAGATARSEDAEHDSILERRVSLAVARGTVGTVLEQLGAQVHVSVIGEIPEGQIAVRFRDVSLRNALDALARVVDSSWRLGSNRGRVIVFGGRSQPSHMSLETEPQAQTQLLVVHERDPAELVPIIGPLVPSVRLAADSVHHVLVVQSFGGDALVRTYDLVQALDRTGVDPLFFCWPDVERHHGDGGYFVE